MLSSDFAQVSDIKGILTLNIAGCELSDAMFHDVFNRAVSNGLVPGLEEGGLGIETGRLDDEGCRLFYKAMVGRVKERCDGLNVGHSI